MITSSSSEGILYSSYFEGHQQNREDDPSTDTSLLNDPLVIKINTTPIAIDPRVADALLSQEHRCLQVESLFPSESISVRDNRYEFTPLQRIPRHYLKEITQKSFEEFEKTKRQIEELKDLKIKETDQTNKHKLDALIENLTARYLHFLVKCAKVPIDNIKKNIQLPLIEYIKNNYPLYYRGDKGIAIDLFIDLINKDCSARGIQFGGNKKLQINIIKNEEFLFFMKHICSLTGYEFQRPFSWEEFEQIEIKEKSFIDMTQLMPPISGELCVGGYLQQVTKILGKDTLENIPCGVLVRIGGIEGQDAFISRNFMKGLLEFELYQNILGLNPEILTMKHALIKSGFSLKDLEPYFSCHNRSLLLVRQPMQSIDFQLIQELHENLTNLLHDMLKTSKLKISQHYLSLFQKFQNCLKKKLDEEICNLREEGQMQALCRKYYLETMQELFDKIKQFTEFENEIKFQGIQENSNLIVEDFEYLMVLMDLKYNLYDNLKLIKLFTPHRYAYTSGMRSFLAIQEGIWSLYGDKREKEKIEAIFIENSYYELFEEGEKNFSSFTSNSIHSKQLMLHEMNTDSKDLNHVDVIYSDLYPNFAASREVKKIPVVHLIETTLQERGTSPYPLVFVLDTATTLFFDEEIQEIHNKLSKSIEEGKLIFVVTSSFAKFLQGGAHKYTGGGVFVSAAKKYDDFLSVLQTSQGRDIFSLEAQRFHSICLIECREEIRAFCQNIRKNTEWVYRELQGIFDKESLIEVAKRDENVPMIGLHFEKVLSQLELGRECLPCLIQLMQHYINAKSAQKGLPLCIQNSFAFSHATCIEYLTALRITIGLEEEVTCKEYVNMFAELQNEISSLVEQKENMLSTLLNKFNEMDAISETCGDYAIVLGQTAENGLGPFLTFIYQILTKHGV